MGAPCVLHEPIRLGPGLPAQDRDELMRRSRVVKWLDQRLDDARRSIKGAEIGPVSRACEAGNASRKAPMSHRRFVRDVHETRPSASRS